MWSCSERTFWGFCYKYYIRHPQSLDTKEELLQLFEQTFISHKVKSRHRSRRLVRCLKLKGIDESSVEYRTKGSL
jgi:hypothetical protein